MKLKTYRLFLAMMPFFVAPLAARAGTIGPDAVAYQDDPAHDGSATFQNFSSTPVKMWSTNLGGPVSYPLIAQGEVFVTLPSVTNGTKLYALNSQTGSINWQVTISSLYFQDVAAYDNGEVFVVNEGSTPSMNAYNAASGALLWSSPFRGQSSFTSPPTAINGIVYTGGAGTGGTLYAMSEKNGAVLWTAGVENGDESGPTVTSSGVYVSYVGPQAYDFNPTTGAPIWRFNGPAEGGGGKTTVYYNGSLYVRDIVGTSLTNQNLLPLNATTGQPSTTFQDGLFTNPTAPAFFNGRGYVEAGGGLLYEFDPSSGAVGWSLSSPQGVNDPFVTTPTIINGEVFEGTSGGQVYEFDGASGNLLGMINVGTGINPSEDVGANPLTGLSAGDGLLVIPAGNTVNVYSVVTVPEPNSMTLGLIALIGSIGLFNVHKHRSRLRCCNRTNDRPMAASPKPEDATNE